MFCTIPKYRYHSSMKQRWCGEGVPGRRAEVWRAGVAGGGSGRVSPPSPQPKRKHNGPPRSEHGTSDRRYSDTPYCFLAPIVPPVPPPPARTLPEPPPSSCGSCVVTHSVCASMVLPHLCRGGGGGVAFHVCGERGDEITRGGDRQGWGRVEERCPAAQTATKEAWVCEKARR